MIRRIYKNNPPLEAGLPAHAQKPLQAATNPAIYAWQQWWCKRFTHHSV
jgi:hypothetical protein